MKVSRAAALAGLVGFSSIVIGAAAFAQTVTPDPSEVGETVTIGDDAQDPCVTGGEFAAWVRVVISLPDGTTTTLDSDDAFGGWSVTYTTEQEGVHTFTGTCTSTDEVGGGDEAQCPPDICESYAGEFTVAAAATDDDAADDGGDDDADATDDGDIGTDADADDDAAAEAEPVPDTAAPVAEAQPTYTG